MTQTPQRIGGNEDAWPSAARLVARWLDKRERVDALLETVPGTLTPVERNRCQHLVYGVIRHYGRIAEVLDARVAHPPRFVTRAVLFVACFELIEAGVDLGRRAQIVHHAVDRAKDLASPAEARLVNAVVRRASEDLAAQSEPGAVAPARVLASFFSHPEWLVQRWLVDFGAEATRRLLEWNQSPAPVYARWRRTAEPAPAWLEATRWPGFYAVPGGRWPEVEALIGQGALYVQDPSTRESVELLAPARGEVILDLCAAPGGKSLFIADALGEGRLVAMDLPTSRIDRLKQNLSRTGPVEAALVQGDILGDAYALLKEHRLPTSYPAVLIDAPCSNTGVMRHRIDVKWRLQEGDIAKHARQQVRMLLSAARLVAAGGRLVYSTCSIEAAENERVVAEFLDKNRAFSLEKSAVAFPWTQGHDGAAAFLLRRL